MSMLPRLKQISNDSRGGTDLLEILMVVALFALGLVGAITLFGDSFGGKTSEVGDAVTRLEALKGKPNGGSAATGATPSSIARQPGGSTQIGIASNISGYTNSNATSGITSSTAADVVVVPNGSIAVSGSQNSLNQWVQSVNVVGGAIAGANSAGATRPANSGAYGANGAGANGAAGNIAAAHAAAAAAYGANGAGANGAAGNIAAAHTAAAGALGANGAGANGTGANGAAGTIAAAQSSINTQSSNASPRLPGESLAAYHARITAPHIPRERCDRHGCTQFPLSDSQLAWNNLTRDQRLQSLGITPASFNVTSPNSTSNIGSNGYVQGPNGGLFLPDPFLSDQTVDDFSNFVATNFGVNRPGNFPTPNRDNLTGDERTALHGQYVQELNAVLSGDGAPGHNLENRAYHAALTALGVSVDDPGFELYELNNLLNMNYPTEHCDRGKNDTGCRSINLSTFQAMWNGFSMAERLAYFGITEEAWNVASPYIDIYTDARNERRRNSGVGGFVRGIGDFISDNWQVVAQIGAAVADGFGCSGFCSAAVNGLITAQAGGDFGDVLLSVGTSLIGGNVLPIPGTPLTVSANGVGLGVGPVSFGVGFDGEVGVTIPIGNAASLNVNDGEFSLEANIGDNAQLSLDSDGNANFMIGQDDGNNLSINQDGTLGAQFVSGNTTFGADTTGNLTLDYDSEGNPIGGGLGFNAETGTTSANLNIANQSEGQNGLTTTNTTALNLANGDNGLSAGLNQTNMTSDGQGNLSTNSFNIGGSSNGIDASVSIANTTNDGQGNSANNSFSAGINQDGFAGGFSQSSTTTDANGVAQTNNLALNADANGFSGDLSQSTTDANGNIVDNALSLDSQGNVQLSTNNTQVDENGDVIDMNGFVVGTEDGQIAAALTNESGSCGINGNGLACDQGFIDAQREEWEADLAASDNAEEFAETDSALNAPMTNENSSCGGGSGASPSSGHALTDMPMALINTTGIRPVQSIGGGGAMCPLSIGGSNASVDSDPSNPDSPNYNPFEGTPWGDDDGDGISNASEDDYKPYEYNQDLDGVGGADNTQNIITFDRDNNGQPDVYDDQDNDGIPNWADDDFPLDDAYRESAGGGDPEAVQAIFSGIAEFANVLPVVGEAMELVALAKAVKNGDTAEIATALVGLGINGGMEALGRAGTQLLSELGSRLLRRNDTNPVSAIPTNTPNPAVTQTGQTWVDKAKDTLSNTAKDAFSNRVGSAFGATASGSRQLVDQLERGDFAAAADVIGNEIVKAIGPEFVEQMKIGNESWDEFVGVIQNDIAVHGQINEDSLKRITAGYFANELSKQFEVRGEKGEKLLSQVLLSGIQGEVDISKVKAFTVDQSVELAIGISEMTGLSSVVKSQLGGLEGVKTLFSEAAAKAWTDNPGNENAAQNQLDDFNAALASGDSARINQAVQNLTGSSPNIPATVDVPI